LCAFIIWVKWSKKNRSTGKLCVIQLWLMQVVDDEKVVRWLWW
jgi:hypothetical protein